ncbi:MAG: hypothetical protein B6U76_02210 [Desulfurococcales archaeon ex4484_217_2]|nr:MAG: hypothetical protein B6U76_02210 [Desulfurococcales archaeon ex4484_217_2]
MYAKQLHRKEAEELEKIHQQIVEGKITYQQIENTCREIAEKLAIHMYWNKKLSINALSKLYKKDHKTLRRIKGF